MARTAYVSLFGVLLLVSLIASACGKDSGGQDTSRFGTDANDTIAEDSADVGKKDEDADAYNPCDEGLDYCDGECVNVNGSSADHCGACNQQCLSWSGSCEQGTCICDDPNATYCDGYCILTSEDEVNCGECGNVCADHEVCFASECKSLPERLADETNSARSTPSDCGSEGNFDATDPVRLDPFLSDAAQIHAEELAANDGNASTSLSERVEQSEYPGQQAFGGVIVVGTANASEIIETILDNDGQCFVIMNPVADATGIGVAEGPEQRFYWVQVMGED